MIGRRLPVLAGSEAFSAMLNAMQPGDYTGPVTGYTGVDVPSVFYMLPDGSWGHVSSPPHTFRECPDGSLEIRASILHNAPGPYHCDDLPTWHGFLDEGHSWREV